MYFRVDRLHIEQICLLSHIHAINQFNTESVTKPFNDYQFSIGTKYRTSRNTKCVVSGPLPFVFYI